MINRRILLRHAITSLTMTSLVAAGLRGAAAQPSANASKIKTQYLEELKATIPEGASFRIIATAGEKPSPNSDYRWHGSPDGGDCFATDDGGWIYVCNSELEDNQGGVGALRFDALGNVLEAYPILTGTTRNCAGGRTLWGTWLSCEENGELGEVYECDPTGKQPAKKHAAMGAFNHEAVAMDPKTGYAYLTEDRPDGCLYRFRANQPADLSAGVLEVAIVKNAQVRWTPVADPSAASKPLRKQIEGAAQFRGGEGITYLNDHIYFTTKIDNKVWALNLRSNQLSITYDAEKYQDPILTGVDNITVSPSGELLIAEDGGDMQLVGLANNKVPVPLVTLHQQPFSEVTGPAFSPDGTRLYFNSQRGFLGSKNGGYTYELLLPEGFGFVSLV